MGTKTAEGEYEPSNEKQMFKDLGVLDKTRVAKYEF